MQYSVSCIHRLHSLILSWNWKYWFPIIMCTCLQREGDLTWNNWKSCSWIALLRILQVYHVHLFFVLKILFITDLSDSCFQWIILQKAQTAEGSCETADSMFMSFIDKHGREEFKFTLLNLFIPLSLSVVLVIYKVMQRFLSCWVIPTWWYCFIEKFCLG